MSALIRRGVDEDIAISVRLTRRGERGDDKYQARGQKQGQLTHVVGVSAAATR